MSKFSEAIQRFLNGWESSSVHERPKTFFKYLIYFPLNWFVALGLPIFLFLLVRKCIITHSIALGLMSLVPLIVIVYHFTDEYFAFQWYVTGKRKISAQQLITWTQMALALVTGALMIGFVIG